MEKQTIRRIIRPLAAGILCLISLVGWQFYTTNKACDAARMVAADNWAISSSARLDFLAIYKTECEYMIRFEADESKKLSRPLTFKECAEEVAKDKAGSVGLAVDEAATLGDVMYAAVEKVQIPFLLRWL